MNLKATLLALTLVLTASAGHADAFNTSEAATDITKNLSASIVTQVNNQLTITSKQATDFVAASSQSLKTKAKSTNAHTAQSGSVSLYLILVILLACTLRLWLSAGINLAPRN